MCFIETTQHIDSAALLLPSVEVDGQTGCSATPLYSWLVWIEHIVCLPVPPEIVSEKGHARRVACRVDEKCFRGYKEGMRWFFPC